MDWITLWNCIKFATLIVGVWFAFDLLAHVYCDWEDS